MYPSVVANTAKHLAYAHYGDLTIDDMINSQIARFEADLASMIRENSKHDPPHHAHELTSSRQTDPCLTNVSTYLARRRNQQHELVCIGWKEVTQQLTILEE